MARVSKIENSKGKSFYKEIYASPVEDHEKIRIPSLLRNVVQLLKPRVDFLTLQAENKVWALKVQQSHHETIWDLFIALRWIKRLEKMRGLRGREKIKQRAAKGGRERKKEKSYQYGEEKRQIWRRREELMRRREAMGFLEREKGWVRDIERKRGWETERDTQRHIGFDAFCFWSLIRWIFKRRVEGWGGKLWGLCLPQPLYI